MFKSFKSHRPIAGQCLLLVEVEAPSLEISEIIDYEIKIPGLKV